MGYLAKKFCVVGKDGQPNQEETAKRLAEMATEIRAELEAWPGFKAAGLTVTTDEDGKEKVTVKDPIVLDPETLATIREGIIRPLKVFQGQRGGGGGAGRKSETDFARLQVVYSDLYRDKRNLYMANKTAFYGFVATAYNQPIMDDPNGDLSTLINSASVARYVKEGKITDIASPSLVETPQA